MSTTATRNKYIEDSSDSENEEFKGFNPMKQSVERSLKNSRYSVSSRPCPASDDEEEDQQAENTRVRRRTTGRRIPLPKEHKQNVDEQLETSNTGIQKLAFKPRTLSRGRASSRNREDSDEDSFVNRSSSSWASESKTSYCDENQAEKIARNGRAESKWSEAKPVLDRDSSPENSRTLPRSDHTDEEERDNISEDSDVITDPKETPLRYQYPETQDHKTDSDCSSQQFSTAIPYVVKAHARGTKTDHVQCVIVRDRSSIQSKLYPTYELILEDSKKKLVIATKMSLNRTSNYHFFDMTRGQAGSKLSKKSGNYLGKLRAKNLNRTDYVLVTHASEREEVAGICFDRLGLIDQLKEGSQPRKMMVMLPHLDSNKVPIPNRVKENGDGSVIEMLRSPTPSNFMLTFESKDPVYENGNYRLNFNGRVSVPSVKNFQLVSKDNIDNVICQFGKVGEDRFHLDFKSPLNAFQAFALALCQFNV